MSYDLRTWRAYCAWLDAIKTLSLAIIAACYLANTLAVYGAEGGGSNICAGNFCYHIEGTDL